MQGPVKYPTELPLIAIPTAVPRPVSQGCVSAKSAKPMTQVTAADMPWSPRASRSNSKDEALAKSRVEDIKAHAPTSIGACLALYVSENHPMIGVVTNTPIA